MPKWHLVELVETSVSITYSAFCLSQNLDQNWLKNWVKLNSWASVCMPNNVRELCVKTVALMTKLALRGNHPCWWGVWLTWGLLNTFLISHKGITIQARRWAYNNSVHSFDPLTGVNATCLRTWQERVMRWKVQVMKLFFWEKKPSENVLSFVYLLSKTVKEPPSVDYKTPNKHKHQKAYIRSVVNLRSPITQFGEHQIRLVNYLFTVFKAYPLFEFSDNESHFRYCSNFRRLHFCRR